MCILMLATFWQPTRHLSLTSKPSRIPYNTYWPHSGHLLVTSKPPAKTHRPSAGHLPAPCGPSVRILLVTFGSLVCYHLPPVSTHQSYTISSVILRQPLAPSHHKPTTRQLPATVDLLLTTIWPPVTRSEQSLIHLIATC